MNTYRRICSDPSDWFAASEVAKAKDYQRPLTVVRIAWGIVAIAVLLAFVTLHGGPRLADALAGDVWTLRLLVVLAAFTLLFTLLELPFSLWTTFVHERRWGFSTQTPKGFVADQLKGLVLGFVIQGALLVALWWLIRTTELWWLAGWAVFFVFAVLLSFLYPVLIAPIFNKFTPLEDPELGARLRSLAEGTGMRVSGVQVMDASKRTRKDNAYFAGIGRTRQIVLFDNLLSQAPGVIASVVAHELGHWRRRHIARSIAVGTITSLGSFLLLRVVSTWEWALNWAGVSSVRDPASLPLVVGVFVAAGSLTGVVQAWLSRAHERQADIEALEITNDYDAFIEMERGLSTRNLIELAPSRLRYIQLSHPPPAERLQLAALWREGRESPTTVRG